MKKRFIASNTIKRVTLFMLVMLTWNCVNAESIVYVISNEVGGGNPTLTLSIDGKSLGSIAGSVKKTIDPTWGSNIQIPFVVHKATIKKCIFNTDGKVLFRIDGSSTSITDPSSTAKYYGEVQLNLEDGQTYYIQLKAKGLTDCKLVEIPEKKGLKELSNKKKYEVLPDWIQPEE